MNTVDFILQMNSAKEVKYKDLIKLPKKAVMFIGKPDTFNKIYS